MQLVEDLGFDSFWLADHPTWTTDCWAGLAALAVTTTKLRLGTLVSCIYYRHPAILARMAADVDRLSNGRLVLGVGIGDAADEFAGLGLPFPAVRDRQQALEETIHIVHGLWDTNPLSYHGTHFQVTDITVAPGPVQHPRVPLLIAGGGERVTLRQVAQFADVANFAGHIWAGSAFNRDDIVRKCAALRRHCETLGRAYDSIIRSYTTLPLILAERQDELETKVKTYGWGEFWAPSTFAGTPAEAIAYYQGLIDVGMQYFIAFVSENDVETVRLLAEQVMPALVAA